jgi:DeoR family transcriptional regulator, deoxyribose operon repressor
MPNQKRQDRIENIIRAVHLSRGASIHELARALGVSEMTIRRDLEVLSESNRVRLVHAGAVPVGGAAVGPVSGYSLVNEAVPGAEERMRIGQKAASLIEPGDVVIIDSGPTTEWLARSIPDDLPVTILCFALNVLLAARPGKEHAVVFPGGTFDPRTLVFDGPEGVSLVRRFRANKAFLTAGGVHEKLGATCTSPGEAELKKAAIACAQNRVLLADSRVFGAVKASWFADLAAFDAIVTDPGVSLGFVEALRQLGISLHVV